MLTLVIFLLWAGLWGGGGWLMAVGLRLPRREQFVTGLALGLVVQLWVSNLLAQVLPIAGAFWLGALAILSIGGVFAWPMVRTKGFKAFSISLEQTLVLGVIVYVFTLVSFGLNIFDDYQNLPMVSLMATGDIPPHFALDPKFIFSYHYILLLFGAQLTRLGNILPWTAMDLARSLVLALYIMLVYLWTRRMTRNLAAGILGGLFAAFSSGARWLFLLLPPVWVDAISSHIQLIGSGQVTGDTLSQALIRPWAIEGAGPMGFPFAFSNGINGPSIMVHNGTGMIVPLISMLILLLYRRWRDWRLVPVLVVLFSAWALGSEFDFLLLLPNLAAAAVLYFLVRRTRRIPRSILPWAGIMLAASIFAVVQGGVLTSIAQGVLQRLTGGVSESYHTFDVHFSWPPSVISAHLGRLTLSDPSHLLAALFEMGPILLALPLVFVWGFKMVRAQRWWEAVWITGALTGMATLFVQYEGSAGISANSRLLGSFLMPATLYAVPLGWAWAKRKTQGLRAAMGALGAAALFGGVFLFGIELIAAQKPVLPEFIHEMDARMFDRHWNQLGTAEVFDLTPVRSVTIFGRYSTSYETWYVPMDHWEALTQHPDPYVLNAAGYGYIYFGVYEWEQVWDDTVRVSFADPCIRLVDEVKGIRGPQDYRKDFRRLLDISACK